MAHSATHHRPLHRLGVRLHVVRRRTGRAVAALRVAIGRTRDRLLAATRRLVRWAVPLAILAALGFGIGGAISVAYGQFGAHPGRNATEWAIKPAVFDGTASCAVCHPGQAATWAKARHAGTSCESCHGPLTGHPAVNPSPELLAPEPSAAPAAAQGLLSGVDTSPPTALCLACHQAIVGRPTGFAVIDPSRHFTGPSCVACHDPHAATAPTPPIIRHPLIGLPECTVCHSPTGMRPVPASHPTWSGSCLACHRKLPS
ncbi:MAG TPA: multiheme c-type cytochrome [Candidatus Limnocylindrales bacterium]